MKANSEDISASDYCMRSIAHFRGKADNNKRESLACFLLIIGCTLTTPLFVSLGTGFWYGKVVPSILSLLAAGATAWIQLRKPQQLWTLYRSAERELESYLTRFIYRLSPFKDSEEPEKLLAEKVADLLLQTHRQWAPMVPSPDKLDLPKATSN